MWISFSGHLPVFGSFFPRVAFFACEGKGTGRLHPPSVAIPSPCHPPLLVHAGAVHTTRLTPLTPSPSTHIVLIPSPRLKFVGRSASCNVGIQKSPKRLLGLINWGPDIIQRHCDCFPGGFKLLGIVININMIFFCVWDGYRFSLNNISRFII